MIRREVGRIGLGVIAAVAATVVTSQAQPRAALGDGHDELLGAPLVEHAVLARSLPAVLPGASAATIFSGQSFFPQSVASGDPRPDSVVLWTRVNDASLAGSDLPVRLIVTRDPFFHNVVENRVVIAEASHDHCVKVKVDGLEPGTRYIYLFVYYKGGDVYLSRPGLTSTAPSPGSDTPVRFAVFNCQDFKGRYYNTIAEALLTHANDLDFVVHLGDYVYETTSGPPADDPGSDRWFTFTDREGSIPLGGPSSSTRAAASLSNYRQLYRVYRSDPMLRRLHERVPMIAIWDDHEYADDCWGDTSTDFGGRIEESNAQRRRNAEQAYFEYMPVDWGLDDDGLLAVDEQDLYPNATLYRDFRFGSNLHLVMTDYRSFRPDHLIPEDAFPGKIVMDRSVLEAVLGSEGYAAVAPRLDPYFNAESDPLLQATLAAVLSQLYLQSNPFFAGADAAAAAAAAASGKVSATYINALFAGAGVTPPFDETALAAMDRGLSYLFLGKQSLYGRIGARYMVVKDTFELYAKFRAGVTGGAAQDSYGATQRTWLGSTLAASDATWRVLGSSTSYAPLILDFTNPTIAAMLPPGFPSALRTRLLVNADHWDGFPDARRQLLEVLRQRGDTVLISGDIHASFVSDHGGGLFEFTGPAVSSATWEDEVLEVVESDPLLSQVPGIDQLVAQIGTLFQISSLDPAVSPARLVDTETGANGFFVVSADSESLGTVYYHIEREHVSSSYYDSPATLDGLFTTTSWVVENGVLSPQ